MKAPGWTELSRKERRRGGNEAIDHHWHPPGSDAEGHTDQAGDL